MPVVQFVCKSLTMASVGTKRFWAEFIKLYRSFPEVWNITSEKYKDKYLKAKAYDKLAAKLKELDEDADRDTVIKKINTLRGNYRRELKKVLQSEKSGEPFESSLWYFNLLDFLRSVMKPSPQFEEVSTYDSIDNSSQMDNFTNSNNVESRKPKRQRTDEVPHSANVQLKVKKLRFLETAVKILRGTQDEAEIYANVWAAEFRKLDDLQKLHAKRAIDEVLYQGRFDNLSFQSAHIITAEKDEYSLNKTRDKELLEDELVEEDVNGEECEEEELLDLDEGKPIIMATPITLSTISHTESRQCQSKYRRN